MPTISAPNGEPPILKAPPGHGPRRVVRGCPGTRPTAKTVERTISSICA
jgi:hypothetical protein